jgi:hypothetical protein
MVVEKLQGDPVLDCAGGFVHTKPIRSPTKSMNIDPICGFSNTLPKLDVAPLAHLDEVGGPGGKRGVRVPFTRSVWFSHGACSVVVPRAVGLSCCAFNSRIER